MQRRPIKCTKRAREKLERLARSSSAEHRLVVRARIVLRALDGLANARIAQEVGVSARTVYEWIERFRHRRKLTTLADRPRSGRPSTIGIEARCEVIRLACERPEGAPDAPKASFRDVWTYESLQEAAVSRGAPMSRSEVYRTLHDRELRPHRVKMWLHSQDPEFRAKANRLCRLYRHPPRGASVVCVDEKTGMQAVERKYPDRAAVPGRSRRREYEYKRHGTRTLIAAFDVVTGNVFGRCGATRTAKDLMSFMEELALRYPQGPVYTVWDNLNTHCGPRWAEFSARHGGRFHFVHTPIHASWLNQVEIWFGILHKRVLKYGSFKTPQELADRVCSFVDHWNDCEKHPFRWKFRGFRANSDLRRAA